MPRHKPLRRRPSTPNLQLAQQYHPLTATAAAAAAAAAAAPMPAVSDHPTSPPETPETSPAWSRKMSLKPRHQPPYFDDFGDAPLEKDPSIQPVGNGHQFSYRPKQLGPEQLSPRSPSSSSSPSSPSELEAEDDSDDDDSSDSPSPGSLRDMSMTHDVGHVSLDEEDDGDDESEESSLESDSSQEDSSSRASGSDAEESEVRRPPLRVNITSTSVTCDFVIEDVDPMDSDCDGLEVLLPTEIESIRSKSRSRSRQRGLARGMMQEFQNLNCSNEISDADTSDAMAAAAAADLEAEEALFLERQRELKRIRRVSMSSSFGKRTHSEMSDSDDDYGPGTTAAVDGVDDAGSSARRLRKRLHRTSLLFQDPPAPRIEEVEEPESSEDDLGRRRQGVVAADQSLARELPYWTMEIMEADSS